jgi:MFS transporter, FHS family, glucose/mannose:H+ symporter
MLVFGIVLTTLGAVLPSVIERFGLAKENAAALFLLLTFGILAGSLVFGPVVDRHGYKAMLLAATALIVAGIETIALASSLSVLRAGILLIGFGGGVVNGGSNALVADLSASGRSAGLNFLGVFFGIGAVGVPFTLGVLAGVYTAPAILAAVGLAVLGPLAFIATTSFPEPKQPQGFPLADGARLLRDPFILLTGFMLFLESGIEITVGGWTTVFFSEELRVGADRALIMLSLYWLGLMVARLALGTVLRAIVPARALAASIAVSLLGSALLLSARDVPVAALGVFLLGAGFAATFPVVLAFVGDRYATLSGTAFSIVFVMALTGGMILPYITGVLGGARGLRTSFLIVPAALVVIALLLSAIRSSVIPATAIRKDLL